MKILWVDDNFFSVQYMVEYLIDSGYKVDKSGTIADCISKLELIPYDLVIIDVMMKDETRLFDEMDIRGGYDSGKALSRHIRSHWPTCKIVGCSGTRNEEVKPWFLKNYDGYIDKAERWSSTRLTRAINDAIEGLRTLKTFIVHGHDEELLAELKEFISTSLKLPSPVVLRELASKGKTIIEKFEDGAEEIDLCFILLTPDDRVVHPVEDIRRARQNVIFELGYFFAKLNRKSGRIILLYKGELDLPSDITGIVYLQIKEDIKSIGDDIKRELEGLLHHV